MRETTSQPGTRALHLFEEFCGLWEECSKPIELFLPKFENLKENERLGETSLTFTLDSQ